MMWKIWLGLGVASVAGVITILMGIITQARFTVIFYRAAGAIMVLGGFSYLIAILYEKVLLPYLLHKNFSAQDEEKIDQQEDEVKNENKNEEITQSNEEITQNKFSPFTTENLNRVSPPNS